MSDTLSRTDRLLRTPLVFETLEPRVLLLRATRSPPPRRTPSSPACKVSKSWSANQLTLAAQLAQQLPVVSTSVGDLVDLPAQVQTHILQPIQTYFASTTAPTYEGVAAALQQDPAEAGQVLGDYAHGEYLFTLSSFQTSAPITAALNLSEDSAGIGLSVAAPPGLSGQATISMALTFGFDTGTENTPNTTPTFFIQPTTITEGVSLAIGGFNGSASLAAANATVTGGAASVSATATLRLSDPIAGDTSDTITPAELAGVPLASIVSTTLSGTGSVTLPITSSLVSGGSQTLQLNWTGNLAAEGSSNLATLDTWAKLDTVSPSLLRQSVSALPGVIQAADGGAGFGADVPGTRRIAWHVVQLRHAILRRRDGGGERDDTEPGRE